MKQTAVEWLQQALEHTILSYEQKMQTIGLFEQAKQIEKHQIMQAWIDGMKSVSIAPFEDEFYNDEAERYYENR